MEEILQLCSDISITFRDFDENNKELLVVTCDVCNLNFRTKIYLVEDHKFGCPECFFKNNKKKFTLGYIIYKIDIENSDLNLKVIDNIYKGNNKPLKVKCITCNNEFGYYYCNLSKKQICKKCSVKINADRCRLPYEKVKSIVESFNLKLLSTSYETTISKLEVMCPQNHIFYMDLDHIRRGQIGCECSTIQNNLSEVVCIKYMEYLFDAKFKKTRFPWLITEKGYMMLDGYNDDLKTAIEYDGKQHFEFVKYFHKTEEHFLKRQNDDRIKDELCKQNGVTLIRVPYTVQFKDMLEYIKNQCRQNNLTVQDKENISTNDLNLHCKRIEERNQQIDDKLKGSIWIRKDNFTKTIHKIKLQCKICHSLREDVIFTNLMKKDRVVPECDYCYLEQMGKKVDNIIEKTGWIRKEKYVHYKTRMNIECANCHLQKSYLPKSILNSKKIAKCVCDKW